MYADNYQSDFEDFVYLVKKWSVLLYPQAPLPLLNQHVTTESDSIDVPDNQSLIIDDFKSDLAFMQNVTRKIDLGEDSSGICKNFAKVAMALQLSHASYSTITEALTALQDMERISNRLSLHLHRHVTKTEQFLSVIQSYSAVADASEETRRADGAELSAGTIEAPTAEAELINQKKILKYTESSEAFRIELETAGVFSLCPVDTTRTVLSPNSIGPLPHTALVAFASHIRIEEEKQLELQQKLAGLYGVESFSLIPNDRDSVEREIDSLRQDCSFLEEQMREGLVG